VLNLHLSQARIKEEGSAVGLRPTRVKNVEQQKQGRKLKPFPTNVERGVTRGKRGTTSMGAMMGLLTPI